MVRCFIEGMSVKEKITQGSCFLLTGALEWMSPEIYSSESTSASERNQGVGHSLTLLFPSGQNTEH